MPVRVATREPPLPTRCADRGAELFNRTSTVVNLGTGIGSTVLEVVKAAGEAVGSPIPYEIGDRRPGDAEKIWADPSLARELLGWTATRDLSMMLADHWRWQRKNPQGYRG